MSVNNNTAATVKATITIATIFTNNQKRAKLRLFMFPRFNEITNEKIKPITGMANNKLYKKYFTAPIGLYFSGKVSITLFSYAVMCFLLGNRFLLLYNKGCSKASAFTA